MVSGTAQRNLEAKGRTSASFHSPFSHVPWLLWSALKLYPLKCLIQHQNRDEHVNLHVLDISLNLTPICALSPKKGNNHMTSSNTIQKPLMQNLTTSHRIHWCFSRAHSRPSDKQHSHAQTMVFCRREEKCLLPRGRAVAAAGRESRPPHFFSELHPFIQHFSKITWEELEEE